MIMMKRILFGAATIALTAAAPVSAKHDPHAPRAARSAHSPHSAHPGHQASSQRPGRCCDEAAELRREAERLRLENERLRAELDACRHRR